MAGFADTTPPLVRARRLISVLAMLAGALAGGVLLRWVALAAPLWLAAVVLVACAVGAYAATSRPLPRWAAYTPGHR
jgi:uncharacterized membrane protein YoaK (UPF0700 family)